MAFGDVAEKYWAKGYSVIPVKRGEKAPVMLAWSDYCKRLPSEEELARWLKTSAGDNIGLCCGEASGIVAVDVDFDLTNPVDAAIFKRIAPLIPYSAAEKVGQKGFTRFFKVSNEITRSVSFGEKRLVEIFTNGKQTVIPPSIHPITGNKYYWKGQPLFEINKEYLPVLPEGLVSKLEKLALEFGFDKSSSGGRNDKLKGMAFAAFCKGKSVDEAIEELFDFDSKSIEPLFSDTSESQMKNRKPYDNAVRFVKSCHKTFKGFNPEVTNQVEVLDRDDIQPFKEDFTTQYLLPPPLGIMSSISEWIKQDAYFYNHNYVVGSTISFFGGLIGNKFSLNNIYSNQYIFMIGKSSEGKTVHINSIRNLINECELFNLIFADEFKSDVAILVALTKRQSFLSLADEISWLFQAAHNKRGFYSRIKTLLSEIWSRPGTSYRGRFGALDKEAPQAIMSPCLSFLFSTTPDALLQQLDGGDIEQGFLGRCLFLFSNGQKFPKEPSHHDALIKQLKPVLQHLYLLVRTSNSVHEMNKMTAIKFSSEQVEKAFNDSLLKLFALKESLPDDTRGLAGKYTEFLTKLVLISTISRAAFSLSVSHRIPATVSIEDVSWAYEFLETYHYGCVVKLQGYVFDSEYSKSLSEIKRCIEKHAPITKRDLHRSFRTLPVNELEYVLSKLKMMGEVTETQLQRGRIVYNVSQFAGQDKSESTQ